jgi:hypothetical protein
MASGRIMNMIPVRPYQKGDSITIPAWNGILVGQTISAKGMRIYIPLPKPVASGVTAKGSGRLQAAIGKGSIYSFNVSTTTLNICANSVWFTYTHGSNVWTTNCSVAMITGNSGFTITFE